MLNSVHTPGLELAGGPSPQDAYRVALRHSARVRRLKVLLPAAAVAITFAFIAVSIAQGALRHRRP